MEVDEELPDWYPADDVMNKDVMLTSNSLTRMKFNDPTEIQYIEEDPGDYDKYAVDLPSDEESSALVVPERNRYKLLTFKNGADVSSVPIHKDGMAVCEKCGTIGVKHAFYSKSKRFCSLDCSRTYKTMERLGKPIPKPQPVFKFPLSKVKFSKKNGNPAKKPLSQQTYYPVQNPPVENGSFNWESYLKQESFIAAPVSSFKHVPLNDCWDSIMVSMKVEVENRDYHELRELFPHSYWVAGVIQVSGYKARLRYEGYGSDSKEDFWLNMCKEHVQPVGWCASQGKPLIPPKSVQHKYEDWKDFLVKRLTGARTVPADFHKKVEESMVSPFKVDMALEVVDKNRISNMRVAYVEQNIGGRLHVMYRDFNTPDDGGFWCHERSPLIHPRGWSHMVDHDITSTSDDEDEAETDDSKMTYREFETKWDMFLHPKTIVRDVKFKEGMKLEAIDPLNLSTICVASVAKVLKNNYLMIGIDGYNEKGNDWFCHHASSVSIFPAGFCEVNGIDLTPPRGYRGEFKWMEYLKYTKAVAAPVSLFHRELPNHGFKPNMRLEAVDLMEPRLLCVGTVTKVVGRLLRVHFDGWDVSYDQWCDCESPDLYPVGWCETVGYHLESPRNMVDNQNSPDSVDKKRKGKSQQQHQRGPKKKKKGKLALATKQLKTVAPGGKQPPIAKVVGTRKSSGEDSAKVYSVRAPKSKNSAKSLPLEVEDDDSMSSSMDDVENEEGDVWLPPSGPQSTETSGRIIPKLVGNSVGAGPTLTSYQRVITPELWTTFDVSQFLRINDCAAYSETFSKKKIDGRKFLTLTKEQIVSLTGMKVGPSLKIFDLIKQLKAKI